MKITHVDLDALGTIILLKKFAHDNSDTCFCEAGYADDSITEFLNNIEAEDEKDASLIITDNCMSDALIERIEKMRNDGRFKTLLYFDHHPKNDVYAASVNYSWIHLTPSEICATKSLYNYMMQTCKYAGLPDYHNFVENVNDWATFNWKKNGNQTAVELNLICLGTPKRNFINRYLVNSKVVWSAREKELLETTYEKINKAIANYKPFIFGKTCYVFYENFVSEISEDIFEKFPEVQINVLIKMSTGRIAYRSRTKDYPVDEIARINGGGGHACASGSPARIDDETIISVINSIVSTGFNDYSSYYKKPEGDKNDN